MEEVCDSELANKIGMGVFRPVFFNLASGKPADTKAAHAGFEVLASVLLPYLQAQLGEREYMAGDAFSIADIALTTQLMNLNLVGFALPKDRFGRCARILSAASRVRRLRILSNKIKLPLKKWASRWSAKSTKVGVTKGQGTALADK